MSDIVCHMGLHKTASGTLQRQFFPACADLNLLTTLDPRVRDFIQAVTRKDPLYFKANDALALIAPRLSDQKVNVLSNESLSGPPYAGVVEWGLDHRTPVLNNLKAVFPEARIVLILRRQDGLARSLYRQYVKRGGTVAAGRFFGLDGSGRPPLMSVDRFQFSSYVRYVFDAFDSRVLVLTFEEFLSDQASFLSRLCRFIGVEQPTIALKRENATRLGAFGMEATRLLNFALRSLLNHGPIPGIPVRRYGIWRQVSVVEYIHDYWPGRPTTDKHSALVRVGDEIWAMYKDDNRLIDHELSLGLANFGYY